MSFLMSNKYTSRFTPNIMSIIIYGEWIVMIRDLQKEYNRINGKWG